MQTLPLFDDTPAVWQEHLGPAARILRAFAHPKVNGLMHALDAVLAQAPLRHLVTPGGYTMSVATSSCGHLGWFSDRRGYRYTPIDPASGQPWPEMPAIFTELAQVAAAEAGFPDFEPDACLINCYRAGAKLSLHQDKDERDFAAPIVSVSLGMPAIFLWGGLKRGDKVQRTPLQHGDVVVWGGEDRLRYHGVAPLKEAPHPLLGSRRINLTFRKAG
ncbi:MAG: DNA oxidative demethylase AlkB [Lautropia sp.]|nr:DNA oxidative demethylase AlkB [Lautropia sp.]